MKRPCQAATTKSTKCLLNHEYFVPRKLPATRKCSHGHGDMQDPAVVSADALYQVYKFNGGSLMYELDAIQTTSMIQPWYSFFFFRLYIYISWYDPSHLADEVEDLVAIIKRFRQYCTKRTSRQDIKNTTWKSRAGVRIAPTTTIFWKLSLPLPLPSYENAVSLFGS